MLPVHVREKGGVSMKCSVGALCEISHSQMFVPGNVRPFFHVFYSNGPDPSPVKLPVGKGASTNPPVIFIRPCA